MSFDKLFKNSMQHISRNKGLAFASIIVMTLTFLISSAFGLAYYVTTAILDYVDKKIPVTIFVENTATQEQLNILYDNIKTINSQAETQYNSKETSYQLYLNQNSNNPSLIVGVTPDSLPAFIKINTPSQKDILTLYDGLVDRLFVTTDRSKEELKENKINYFEIDGKVYLVKEEFKYILGISISQTSAEFFQQLKDRVQILGALMGIFLILVSVIIIFVTTGMAIYTNREEIETMELVGATPAYVRFPYIFDGAIFGFLGALFSTAALFAVSYFDVNSSNGIVSFLNKFFKDIKWLDFNIPVQLGIFLAILLIGTLAGAISAWIATRRYLK